MSQLTRTLRFEVVFLGLRKSDRAALYARLWGAMDDLTLGANRAVSHLYLHHTGIQVLGPVKDGKPATAPRSLVYQLLSGSGEARGVPQLYTPGEGRAVSGGVKSATANLVHLRLTEKRRVPGRKQALPGWLYAQQGRESLPNFRRLPLCFRASEVEVRQDGSVGLKVWAGRAKPLHIAPRRLDRNKRSILRRLISGEYTQGGAKLAWDQPPGRKGRWMLSLAWTGEVAQRDANRVAAVHLGVFCAAYLVTAKPDGTTGKDEKVEKIDLPLPLVRAYNRAAAEKRELLHHNRQARGLREGRGRQRKLRVIRRINERLGRVSETAVEAAAAAVIGTAIKRGAGLLYLEDVSGVTAAALDALWDAPVAVRAGFRRRWFERRIAGLREQIAQVAEREGITIVEVPRVQATDERVAVHTVLESGVALSAA